MISVDRFTNKMISVDRFTNNFGVLGILDRLHGTDQNFRASKAYQRHILLLGLIPLSQQIPESPSKKSE
jgi:methylsterol monooxygenase